MEYRKAGKMDRKAGAIIAARLFLGAWVGAKWSQHVGGVALQRGFAAFLVVIAIREWIKASP